MKKDGFTLIELLAVIVILAIIALIAVPIILNIIGDTKKQSDERSIELYGDAIKNAVADYSIKNPTDEEVTFEDIEEDYIEYEGSKVECSTHEIYSDGTIWLNGCTVNDKPVEYEYGEKKIILETYYGYWLYDDYGWDLTVGGTTLPEELSKTPPTGKNAYLKLDTDGTTVSAAYSCFKRGTTEYCLKGGDGGASYEENQEIMRKAFASSINSCAFSDFYSGCRVGSLNVGASSDVDVYAYDDSSECRVDAGGAFYCY